MSNPNPFASRGRATFPTMPRGEVLATYDTYEQAQRAVDALARADFPVKRLSIVGSNLQSVERVTGKLSYGRVAIAGAASGAWMGLFFGLLLIIFSPSTNFAFVFAALLIGAGFGMLFGIVSYAINRRRRDFTSVMQVIAGSYSILVDPELINKARNTLQGTQVVDVARPDETPEEPETPDPTYDPSPPPVTEPVSPPPSQPLPPADPEQRP